MSDSEDDFESSASAPRQRRPSRQSPPPPQLGDYIRGARLGRGGMGMVYEARDRNLRREAALKVLTPSLAQTTENFERLRREAQSAAGLDHPNIVRVFAFGVDAGFPYIAMERLRGRDLNRLLAEEGAVEPRRAVRMIREAAEALEYAAGRKLIHRDIKPSNLFLTGDPPTQDGTIKVLDFGLVRQTDADKRLTRTGVVLGTPGYMSPEQVRNVRDLDFRSDMYSLGLTFYALLSGVRPYSDDTPMGATVRLVSEGVPIPRAWDRIARGRVTRILRRMTRKDREDRYGSWAELIDELRALETAFADGSAERGGLAFPSPPPHLVRTAGLAMILLLVSGAGIYYAIYFAATGGPASGHAAHTLRPGSSGAVRRNPAAGGARRVRPSVSPIPTATPLPYSDPPQGLSRSELARAGYWQELVRRLRAGEIPIHQNPARDLDYALGVVMAFEEEVILPRLEPGAGLEAKTTAAFSLLDETIEADGGLTEAFRPLLYLGMLQAENLADHIEPLAAESAKLAPRRSSGPEDRESPAGLLRIVNGTSQALHGVGVLPEAGPGP